MLANVSDQAGLNRGPLILNVFFIVTLYILIVRIEIFSLIGKCWLNCIVRYYLG